MTKFRADIQGLRAIAVVSVMLNHTGVEFFKFGYLGVDVFFVISGYLMGMHLISAVHTGEFSFVDFYIRRARRILPALYIVISLSIPVAWFSMLPDDLENFGQSVVATILFSNNILLHLTSGYWDVSSEFKPLLHTWSLGVEEQYYLALPLIILWLGGNAYRALAALIVVSASIFIYSSILGENTYYLIHYRAWELFIGSFLAYLNFNGSIVDKPAIRIFSLMLLCFSMLNLELFHYDLPGYARHIICVIGALGLVSSFKHYSPSLSFLLENRSFMYLGAMSYSLYLVHQPVFAFMRILDREPIAQYLYFLAFVPVIFLSHLLHTFVENPCRKSQLIGNKSFILMAVSLSISLLIVGGYLHFSKGASFRLGDGGSFSIGEQSIDYNMKVFRFKENAVSLDTRRMIFVIGDSYGRDFTNMLVEVGIYSENAVRYSDVLPGFCDSSPFISDENIKSGDVVYLVFKRYDGLCYDRFNDYIVSAGARLIVVGPKDFGYNLNPFIRTPSEERAAVVTRITSHTISRNEVLKKTIPAKNFIDLVDVLANGKREIRVFDDNGHLLSVDGLHLTEAGAKFFGNALSSRIK